MKKVNDPMEKLITTVIISNTGYDFLVNVFKDNGYQLLRSFPRPKYYVLGPVVYELTFLFNPSEERIKRWIDQFIIEEQYEQIEVWQRILQQKKQMRKHEDSF